MHTVYRIYRKGFVPQIIEYGFEFRVHNMSCSADSSRVMRVSWAWLSLVKLCNAPFVQVFTWCCHICSVIVYKEHKLITRVLFPCYPVLFVI